MRRDTAETDGARFPGLGVGSRIIRLIAWSARAKFTHGALVIVRDEGDRVLLVRQRFRERNCWGLPGGFMNIKEGPAAAAIRELREETGLEVPESALEVLAEYRQPWAWHYDHLFGLIVPAQRETMNVRSLEIMGIAWVAPTDVPPLTRAAQLALQKCGWIS